MTTKMTEIAPRPNATGAPQRSVASVTVSTIMPCVVGLIEPSLHSPRRCSGRRSRLGVQWDVERRFAPRDELRDIDHVLQRKQAEPDRHRRIRNPQPRAPHRVGYPALVQRFL